MTPIGCGQDPAKMRALASATGVNVIAATGYHRDAHYPAGHWVHKASQELLVGHILHDLCLGMHPHDWLGPSVRPDVVDRSSAHIPGPR